MNGFDLTSFRYKIICEGKSGDAEAEFLEENGALSAYITAGAARPEFLEIRWDFESGKDLYVLGDAWERTYGDVCFRNIEEAPRVMPWYFAATDREKTWCFGVKTGPNAFVDFRYDRSGVRARIDCRNGGCGVKLGGRKLKLCTFVFRAYDLPPFESLSLYLRTLCDAPLLPKEKIYGGNNWYYAYGKSSFEELLRDAKLQSELAEGIPNRPFMVADDGWQLNSVKGPYRPNERFRDMKALAGAIRDAGARPGLWVRLLDDLSGDITEDMRILRNGERIYLDPTDARVKDYLRREIARFRSWGYELLKHDYTTVDLFGDYGVNLPDTITNFTGWHFQDESKTNAEIVLDLYRLILEAAGDMLIIGCNTVSHLCAGLVHINRTGDDTSGREWERTKKMGVNTLAFRLAQNKAFYLVDADCVGILDDNIPWEKNRQWMDLLSKSDTALFLSCAEAEGGMRRDIMTAYREIQKDHTIEPVDIYENLTPSVWRIDGDTVTYDWEL